MRQTTHKKPLHADLATDALGENTTLAEDNRLSGKPSADPAVHRIGFLLVPGFSYIAFACAIEPLRMANMAAGRTLFEAVVTSVDGAVVAASNGVRTLPDYAIDDIPSPAAMLVCGPNPIEFPDERRLIHWLHRLASRRISLGGIDTGSVLLARAHLLNGYRCTLHWQDRDSMLGHFPGIIVSDHLYEIDRDRLTSGGGTAAMDMMLHYISLLDPSDNIAPAAAELLVHDRIRIGRESQRLPLIHLLGRAQPKLRDAVTLMEANIEQPLSVHEIAAHTALSERQLERLFVTELDYKPIKYYLHLRLNTARNQLLHSDQSIAEIARSCGFNSGSYFARCYRKKYDTTPSQERRRRRD